MVTRVHFDDADEAEACADALADAGHEVAVVKERLAGEDDDEELIFVVATTAPADVVRGLDIGDAFVETDE